MFNFYHQIKRNHPVMAWMILATILLGGIIVAYFLVRMLWPRIAEYSETIVGAALGLTVYDAWCFACKRIKKPTLWKKVILSIAFCSLAGFLMGYLRKIGFFHG